MNRLFASGAFLAGLAVALGAVGAHALKDTLLAAGRTETFELAVRYMFYSAVGLIALGLFKRQMPGLRFSSFIAGLFLVGTFFFSGSLIALCLTPWRWVVFVTPVGGFCMIAGWVVLGWGAWREESL